MKKNLGNLKKNFMFSKSEITGIFFVFLVIITIFGLLQVPLQLHFPQFLSNLKVFGESIKPLFEIFAMVTVGLWTYLIFIKDRVDYPIAKINHKFSHWRLDEKYNYLSVILTFKNIGKALIKIDCYKIFIDQILPLDNELQKTIHSSAIDDLKTGKTEGLFCEMGTQIMWPRVGVKSGESEEPLNANSGQEETDKTLHITIEPGETEEFHFEFFLSRNIKKIKVISYFHNPKYPGEKIGWRKTDLYSLDKE